MVQLPIRHTKNKKICIYTQYIRNYYKEDTNKDRMKKKVFVEI